jgi:hypothetical protein
VERIVIEFSDPAPVRRGFALLVEQADGGQLQVRDLEFLHSIYGVASTVAADRVDPVLAGLDGAASGLFDRAELDAIAADLAHGRTAAVLAYDGVIDPALASWESGGAEIRRLSSS